MAWYRWASGSFRLQAKNKKMRNIHCCFHISHRCLQQGKALRFSYARDQFVRHLRQMASNFPIQVLNYLVGPDRYRLLVAVAQPRDLSAPLAFLHSATTRDYVSRNNWEGSVWKGKYNLTRIQSQPQLLRCSLDMDFTMVRKRPEEFFHPLLWKHSGHQELTGVRKRNRVINFKALKKFLMATPFNQFREWYIQASNDKWNNQMYAEEQWWEEALVVGEKDFCEHMAQSIPKSHRSLLVYPPLKSIPPLDSSFSWTLVTPLAYKRRYLFA